MFLSFPLTAREIGRNLRSGITVALVSIPLSLSLAIASGAAPITGIITAVWAGFLGGLFGGSRFNILGPAGALSGLLLLYGSRYGVTSFPVLAVMVGAVILTFRALRWDRYIVFIPGSVVHGFTLGVALIIALGQVNFALGLDASTLPKHSQLVLNVWESLRAIPSADPSSIVIFLGTFILLFALFRVSPRIPGAIVVAILGILLGWMSTIGALPMHILTLADRYHSLPAIILQPVTWALPPLSLSLISSVVMIALIAMLETLLAGKIADGMAKCSKFDQRREMLALGMANIASGLCGGLPATGVLARTALNVRSGASSQASAVINAITVGVLALLLFPLFRFLPLAVVAGILVFAAVRMVEAERFRNLLRMDPAMFGLALLVAVITVAQDPTIGILVGSFISLLIFAKQLSRGQSEVTFHQDRKLLVRVPPEKIEEYDAQSDVTVCRFSGEMTYINGQAHLETVKRIQNAHTILISLRNLYYIDCDGVDTLQEIVENGRERQKKVVITGANGFVEPMLRRSGWYKTMQEDGLVYESTSVALRELGLAP